MYDSGYKLIILFHQPPDPAEFERRWSEEFIPLVEQLPGLKRVVVSHTHGGPAGPVDIYLVQELHFATQAQMTEALNSPQGVTAGQCLVHLGGRLVTLLFAEHMEDRPRAGENSA